MKIFTIAIGILISINCFGQVRRVTGVLTDESNLPMPGVNVVVKGTDNGTITDIEGRYSIDAPVGSVLVFSFIGMQTREAVVTINGLMGTKARIPGSPAPNQKYPSSWADLPSDTTGWNKPGVAVIDNNAGHVINKQSIDPENLLRVRRYGRNFLFLTGQANTYKPFTLQLTTAIGLEQANRWPSLQSTFAQGRSSNGTVQWRGPDQGETFSYGPLVRTLEYDGSIYQYDPNGRLVSKGTGNGVAANAYDPLSIFRSIVSTSTQLTVAGSLPGNTKLSGSLERRDRSGIIPGSSTSLDNLSIKLIDYSPFNKLKVSGSTAYQQARGRLLPHGSNLSNIIYRAYTTPPTYYNSSVGSEIKALPDRDKNVRSLSILKFAYTANEHLTLNVNSNYEYQQSNIINGVLTGPDSRSTQRDLARQNFYSITSLTWNKATTFWRNSGLVAWHVNYEQNNLDRTDSFTDASIKTENKSYRTANEIITQGTFEYDNLFQLKVANRAYFSNTAVREEYVNMFPSFSFEYNMGRHLYYNDIEPYVAISRNIHEAPLIWANWSHASTRMNMASAMNFYEAGELFFDKTLVPETDVKVETGLKTHFNNLTFDIGYYNNTTNDMVSPVWQDNRFTLMNVAVVNTSGVTAYARHTIYAGNVHLTASINWSKYNSVVRDVYVPGGMVHVAGFSEVSAVIAKGEPLGAIYGTTYLRDNTGALVIDSQGFPMVDTRTTKIGNPVPNWIGGGSISAVIKNRFRFWATMDYRNGGQRWNGTNRVLDYLGMSQVSADQRTIGNYVFDGNDMTGRPNVTPVSFADAGHDTATNRWVRDGYAGAAEQYIEDASWFRMSELGVSYWTQTPNSALMKQLKVSLVATNIFLISKYHGVDPATSLFGYTSGASLDLFNMPGVRGVTATVSINF
ncbi:MAG TPA: TonB-dependent receptor [Cyclobacteriaceae bacterium]|nr:TonB-dependent receptor [Cyclobacteriaceae bacterium]